MMEERIDIAVSSLLICLLVLMISARGREYDADRLP